MKKLALHWQILIAIVLALIFGWLLPEYTKFVAWMGVVFIRALKMIVIPLVLSSIICGVAQAGTGKSLGRLGIKTMIYYLVTSLLAILTGLTLVNFIQPGRGMGNVLNTLPEMPEIEQKSLSDVLIGIIPDNLFGAFSENNAMLSVIFFAMLAGIFITRLGEDNRKQLTGIFNAFFELMMKITLFVMRLAPLGIFGLVAVMAAEQTAGLELFKGLGKYVLTVIIGLIFHHLVTLPLILRYVGRVSPLKHYRAMAAPLITAFSTASSNATLPVTMEAVEEKAGVSNRVSGFVLPLGATINMNGTALYELVVAGFIAQIYGIDLSFSQQFVLVTTALLASVGAAGVPMGSLVTMSIVFSSIGLPLEAVALILPVDRPLDMLRTATNVFGDTCGAVTVASLEGEELAVRRE